MKPRLYLDIDGVLLTKRHTSAPPGILPLVVFAVTNFDCYWLSTHCKGDSRTALAYLARFYEPQDLSLFAVVKPTNWETLKTEGIDFQSNFFWLDDAPFQAEQAVLKQHGLLDRLVVVDLEKQRAIEYILQKLQALLRSGGLLS